MKAITLKNDDGKPVALAVHPLNIGALAEYRAAVKAGDIAGQVAIATGRDRSASSLSIGSAIEVLRQFDELNALALAELEQFEAKRTNTPKG